VPDNPELLTVQEAAKLLRVGRDKAYQLVRAGAIPVVRLGVQYRIPRHALLLHLERQALSMTTEGAE